MKKTENSGLDFRGNGKSKERKRDVVGEMVEVFREAWMEAIKYHEAHIRKSSAMASERERDVVGEMEEKDEVNQIKEYLKAALMLIEYHGTHIPKSSKTASGRTQIQAPESDAKYLQLRLPSSLPDIFYTGNKARGKFGPAIPVKLIDKSTGHVVTSGPVSCAKLDVVAVDGYFDNEDDDDWTLEDFKSHVVTDRDGKKLLTGNLELSLKEGVGSLGELTFTDNSSWMQGKKIRLGVRVASGIREGIRVREAKSNPFVVKDRRGEGCKKHDLPAPDDEVWRLKNIGKNGAFHKKLNEAGIFIVRDFLWKLKLSWQELRKILGTGMSDRNWKTLVAHSETCDLSGKYYVYYADNTKSSGVVFKNIFEFSWLIEGGEHYSPENLSDSQKVFVDTLKRNAWDNFKHTVKYDGPMPSDMNPSKRARSSQTDVVTGVAVPTPIRTPVASRAPAVGGVHSLIAGDGPATASDPSEQAYERMDMAYEDPIFDSMEPLGGLPHRDPSEQAGGNINMGRGEYVLETLSDDSEQAGGTSDLSLALERVMDFTKDDEPLLQPAPVAGGTSDFSLVCEYFLLHYYVLNINEV